MIRATGSEVIAVESETKINIERDMARPSGYLRLKRILDIVAASFLLILSFIPFLIIALFIKLTSKGPVLYRSERIGINGKPFLFPKFRSMNIGADQKLSDLLTDNEKDGPIFKMKKDPRITWIGRYLRRYSLDELPQLFCVLTGEMSMVGPRPPIRREVEQYDDHVMRRLSVKPGMSCYWQVMGRSDLSFAEMVELDLKYADEMSLKTDLKIICLTPKAVLSGKGAY
jgi:lipopolysaccharide/colanic/teichoic acid biosynthesis glycosyltransferase